MAPSVFEDMQFEYVQNHLRILSAFYGVLKPMDGVTPYRLEMQDVYKRQISHRLKSIENADKIVVMKAGTVEACGKHAHLLKQSTTYRKMIEKSNLAEKFNY